MDDMSEETRRAVGLSVGTTNLAAVTADQAVTRTSVLTLYRHRSPEVGVPSENPNLDEPGLVITDFVDRVGDPIGIVAADGSTHRGEVLLVEALRALAYAATGGRPLPEATGVTYPAHWRPGAVDALHAALSGLPEWSRGQQCMSLVSDVAAALTALQADPGVPVRGIIAVCDFGGSGTSITIVDAANGYQPIGPTMRHTDFSGELIDQALLARVVADLSTAGSIDVSGTSAIGSLTRLRAECRVAKKRLSANTATTLTADLPGFRGDIRLTRAELNEAISQPLDQFIGVVQETLVRNGIHSSNLVAVASVGGGASIPEITTRLSEHLRVPVITSPRPHLAAAAGAALRAARGPADNSETRLTGAARFVLTPDGEASLPEEAPVSSAMPALAWSEVGDESGVVPLETGAYSGQADDLAGPSAAPPPQFDNTETASARPDLKFDHQSAPGDDGPADVVWYRRPLLVVIAVTVVVLAMSAAIVIALGHHSTRTPVRSTPSVSTTPQPAPTPSIVPTENPAPIPQAPVQTSSAAPTPPPTTSQPSPTTTQPPPTTSQPSPTTTQPPSTTNPPASSTQPSTQPPSSTENPPTSVQVPTIPQIPQIPQIPTIPSIP